MSGDSQQTSRSLLERAKSNDTSAWGRLVQVYAPLVYHWCRRWQVTEGDIPDIFQEVFRAAAANLSRFHKRKAGDTFRGWLRVITYHKVCDYYRELRHEPRGVGGTYAEDPLAQLPAPPDQMMDTAADVSASVALLRRVLEQVREHFSDQTWSAFWRTAVDAQPAAEVAEELSMSAVAVRVAKSRVLQRLREELGEIL